MKHVHKAQQPQSMRARTRQRRMRSAARIVCDRNDRKRQQQTGTRRRCKQPSSALCVIAAIAHARGARLPYRRCFSAVQEEVLRGIPPKEVRRLQRGVRRWRRYFYWLGDGLAYNLTLRQLQRQAWNVLALHPGRRL